MLYRQDRTLECYHAHAQIYEEKIIYEEKNGSLPRLLSAAQHKSKRKKR
jgi:hypothetical protein